MPSLKCPVIDCVWEYSCEFNNDQSVEIIKLHVGACHVQQSQGNQAPGRSPKIDRPTIDVGIDEEQWGNFVVRWKQFCQGSNLSKEAQSLQLFQCATETLGNLLLKSNPSITDRSASEVLELMKSFAVVRVSKGVQRAELRKMVQGRDEAVRTFVARVQGRARTCNLIAAGECECGKSVAINYTQEVVKDVVMAGIADEEVQTSVLEIDGIEELPLNEIVSTIERKERARKAYRSNGVSALSNRTQSRISDTPLSGSSMGPCQSADVSAISGYKRGRAIGEQSTNVATHPPPRSKRVPCPRCKKMYHQFNGRNLSAFQICYNCYIASRKRRNLSTPEVTANNAESKPFSVLLNQSPQVFGHNNVVNRARNCNSQRDHPRARFRIRTAKSKFATVEAVADTGAQSNLWGLDGFKRAGLDVSELSSASIRITSANRNPINVIGSFEAFFEGISPEGEVVACSDVVYV